MSKVSNSELVRCANQIKGMGFSLFLIVVSLIIFSTIPLSEFKKITRSVETTSTSMPEGTPTTGSDQNVASVPKLLDLLPETINKFYAILFLLTMALIVFVASIFIATSRGCYKTSIFGLLFGLLFGIF